MIFINELILRETYPIYAIGNNGDRVLFEYWDNDFKHYKRIIGNFNIAFKDLDYNKIILNSNDINDNDTISIIEMDRNNNIIRQKFGNYEENAIINENEDIVYHKDVFENELNIEYVYNNDKKYVKHIDTYTYKDSIENNNTIIYEYHPNGENVKRIINNDSITEYLNLNGINKDEISLISSQIKNNIKFDHEYEVNDGKYITHLIYSDNKLISKFIYYTRDSSIIFLYRWTKESDSTNEMEEFYDESEKDKNILYYRNNKGVRIKFIYLDGFYRNENYVTYMEEYNSAEDEIEIENDSFSKITKIEYNEFNKITKIEINGKICIINKYDNYGNIISYNNYDGKTCGDYEKWEYLDGNSDNDTYYECLLDGEYFHCEKKYDNYKRFIYYKDSNDNEVNIIHPIIINQ